MLGKLVKKLTMKNKKLVFWIIPENSIYPWGKAKNKSTAKSIISWFLPKDIKFNIVPTFEETT